VGIGEDGHFASLFPDHPGLSELAEVFAITDSPKPPVRRLTMGLSPIVSAEHVVILALGSAKGHVARQAQIGPQRSLPVSLLPKSKCIWYLDDEAMAVFGGYGTAGQPRS
jgi:6-phosphogluconolactonase